jgi:hypothetical protein
MHREYQLDATPVRRKKGLEVDSRVNLCHTAYVQRTGAELQIHEGQRRDKTGDRCIDRAIRKRADYHKRVAKGEYYGRQE